MKIESYRSPEAHKGFFKRIFDAEKFSGEKKVLDRIPTNILLCNEDFIIEWANQAALKTLQKMGHLLPIDPQKIVGSSIDIFHRNPEHQRRMLSQGKSFPIKATVPLGGEFLDLHVDLYTPPGPKQKYVLSWSVATQRVRAERLAQTRRHMLDQLPVNIMLADPATMEITYANETCLKTLETLQELLPVKAREVVGKSIDIFHKNPQHQRNILSDTSRLPFHSKIKLGKETLDMRVSAVRNDEGEYEAALLCWSVATHLVTMADDFEQNVKTVAETIAGSATEMKTTASILSNAAEEGSAQANGVSAAAEELAASAREVSEQLSRGEALVREINAAVQSTIDRVNQLQNATDQITTVVDVIGEFAGQTNLLALNATIEAARAGEHGKGFAVVAGEVKNLSLKTASAASNISGEVEQIQKCTTDTIESIQSVSKIMANIDTMFNAMGEAVTLQQAATGEVAMNINGVSEAAQATSEGATDTHNAASELAETSEFMRSRVMEFLTYVKTL
jgi:methyl-accepting chemotaxis protein